MKHFNNILKTFNKIQTKPISYKSIPLSISSPLEKNPLILARFMSKKPTNFPQNQQRIRDNSFDNYMEIEKKLRKILKFQPLILSQPHQSIPISRLDFLARRIGFKKDEAGKFVLKLPKIFEIYEHPVQRILYLRFTINSLLQIDQEKHAIYAQIDDCVTRLQKLLMLSNNGRLYVDHVRIACRDFGLPDDFEDSVVLKYPEFFRLFDGKDGMSRYIEIVEKDPKLCVCSVDKVREIEYRKKGIDEESMRFSFVMNFPPGFKIGKYFRVAMWRWQRLPYWSPYDDVSGHDMRSVEAQKRMEKRAVALIHELLSLTVEKKISLERIANFRVCMDLPKKLKDFLLQYQGIFYISTRGNQGKLHTVFLREAYKKGDLIEPNDVYLARRKLAELILTSPRKASLGRELVSYTRPWDDVSCYHKEQFNGTGKPKGDVVREQVLHSESDIEVESGFSDDDDDVDDDGNDDANHLMGAQAARSNE